MATVFYARVSTSEQNLDHQRVQAEAMGFVFDKVFADHGVSGVSVKMRDRPQGQAMFLYLRTGDTLVVRWIDRLGRNYEDVSGTIRELLERGITIRTVINGMTFDGQSNDPMSKAVRDALIGFMAAMAEAQAEATKEAQKAGIAAAKAKTDESAYRGRKPSYDAAQVESVAALASKETSVAEIARITGLSRQTVYRIKDDTAGAMKALEIWRG